MNSPRKSALLRILEIDDEINQIKKSSKYRSLRRSLKVLEMPLGHHSKIRVRSLQDSSKVLEVRRNSDQMKNVISDYRDKLREFTDEIDKLVQEKLELRKSLFPQ